MGERSRSGSFSSSSMVAPLGQMKPWLKTSSRSPRAPVTRPSVIVNSRPQVASHKGQIRYAVVIGTPTFAVGPNSRAWLTNACPTALGTETSRQTLGARGRFWNRVRSAAPPVEDAVDVRPDPVAGVGSRDARHQQCVVVGVLVPYGG